MSSDTPSETAPARWFLLQGEEQIGPLELDDVRERILAGEVGPDDYVWADGMPEWMPAGEVPALTPPETVRDRHDHLARWP